MAGQRVGCFSVLSVIRKERTKLPFSMRLSRPARLGNHAMQIWAAFEGGEGGAAELN